jgi:hypothetical protein
MTFNDGIREAERHRCIIRKFGTIKVTGCIVFSRARQETVNPPKVSFNA